MDTVRVYQHGIYPRSEAVVAATRGFERGRVAAADVATAIHDDRRDLIQAQQEAGVDLFSDGLLGWQDIFRPLVDSTNGLEARTLIRWFNNNSFFRAPEPNAPLSLREGLPSVYDDDADIPTPRVATLPSPLLFSRAAQTDGDRGALMLELTREILAPVAERLAARGYEVIQLQEPWLTFFGIDDGDWDDFDKAVGEIKQSCGGATLILHTYFGDAGPYADRLRRLPVDAVGIDFVETDVEALGSNWDDIGLLAGCLDGRSSPMESADGTAAFVQRLVETVQPASLYLSSTCDLEFLPRDVARQKVLRLGEVGAKVKELLT